jgi:hypothetical protein
MAKKGKGVKAKAAAAEETHAPSVSYMPTGCPVCGSAVDAVRGDSEPTKVGGATVQAPGEIIGFVCTAEGCPAFGTQQLFKADEDEDQADEKPEDLSDLPKVLQQAIVAFGLKRDDVLDYRCSSRKEKGEKVESVTMTTRGGQKLTYPGDEAKALTLTDAEKDGVQRTATPRFFPGGLSPQRGAIRG